MADPGRLDELKRKFEENPKRYFAPLANEYRKAGQPDMAIELCRTYLPQQPGHMSGYIVYGQALHDAGQAEESAAVFKQALTLDPENIIALRHLGDIARDSGDSAGAMRWYGKVLEMDPRNEEIAAYITTIANPGSTPPPAPERPKPPAVRPEPEPDASAVRLEDIFSEPDTEQMPIMADEPAQHAYDAPEPPFTHESDEPFEVTQWPTAAERDAALHQSPDSANVLEGPWHAGSEAEEDVEAAHDAGAPSPGEAGQEPSTPLRLSDFMPDEDAAFAPTPEELGEPAPEQAPVPVPEPATVSSGAAAPAAREDSPFVTETMAELYMQQGLRGEALTIYRQLALKRDDPSLQKRIADLEAARTSSSAGETVRAFFARIGARRPTERVELAADRSSPLAALFGSSAPDAGDVAAAQRLSGAFGNPRSGDSQS